MVHHPMTPATRRSALGVIATYRVMTPAAHARSLDAVQHDAAPVCRLHNRTCADSTVTCLA